MSLAAGGCSGDGTCLSQTGNNNYYRDIDCSHQCQPVHCPNYTLCGVNLPLRYLYCHGGRCVHCNMFFGKDLNIRVPTSVDEECGICLVEASSFVQFPSCTHYACVDCFRRIWFGTSQLAPPSVIVDEEDNEEEELSSDGDEDGEEEESEQSRDTRCPLCRNQHIPAWNRSKA